MKFALYFITVSLTMFSCNLAGQKNTDTVPFKPIIYQMDSASYYFKNFIIVNKEIWALTKHNTIEIFNGITYEKLDQKKYADSNIKILSTDNTNCPILATEKREILRYNSKKNSWTKIADCNYEISGILFNSKGNCYAITQRGIADISSGKVYSSNNVFNDQSKIDEYWETGLQCFYMDSKDNIWLGFAYGLWWGGRLAIFNTIQNCFIVPGIDSFDLDHWQLSSFCEENGTIYVSANATHGGGSYHMTPEGILVKFENFRATVLFESYTSFKKDTSQLPCYMYGNSYSLVNYNSFGQAIYLCSQNGLFRYKTSEISGGIEKCDTIIKPNKEFKRGYPWDPFPNGYFRIEKLTFIDKNHFLFLTGDGDLNVFRNNEIIGIK